MRCQKCGRNDGRIYLRCRFCKGRKTERLVPRPVMVIVGGLLAVWLAVVIPRPWIASAPGDGWVASGMSRFRATESGALDRCRSEIERALAPAAVAFSDPEPEITRDPGSGAWEVRFVADVAAGAGTTERRRCSCTLSHTPGKGWQPRDVVVRPQRPSGIE